MKFGLSFLPDARESDLTAREYYRSAVALSVQAEQGGFSSIKMTEHYLHPYGGYCPSPLIFLSAVAARTSRVRLVTGCVLPAFHHPIQLAAQAAQVDAISDGRVEIGFARAYMPYEFAAFGVDMDTSHARYRATIGAVRRLWTEDSVDEESEFFSYRGARSLPRPVQQPHPPMWGAATMSLESFRWIGEQGMGLLITPTLTPPAGFVERVATYRDAHRAATGDGGRVAASFPVHVGDDPALARLVGDEHLRRYLAVWGDAARSWTAASSRDYPGYDQLATAISAATPAGLRGRLGALVGSPDQVADGIGRVCDRLDVDEILVQIDFGAMAAPRAARSLELFCEKVLPQFR